MKYNFLLTGLFYDNEFLDKYLALCASPINNLNLVQEVHHIFPKAAANILKIDIDNSDSNLVTLDIKNHCLAHYYLALCSKDDKLRFGNELCIQLLTHRNFNEISAQWIEENLILINEIRLEQRRLNSELQIGLQTGEKNGNCKYTLSQIDIVKKLLTTGETKANICNITGVSIGVIEQICKGTHWSCKEDNFRYKEIKESKSSVALKNEILIWQKEPHFCKNCDKLLSEYLISKNGNGCFCSTHCMRSWANKEKFKRNPELSKEITKNRNYKGENNPNFGKKATDETRQKISKALKNSEGVKNSPRFSGHTHTAESKQKTSNSLKEAHNAKPNWLDKQ